MAGTAMIVANDIADDATDVRHPCKADFQRIDDLCTGDRGKFDAG